MKSKINALFISLALAALLVSASVSTQAQTTTQQTPPQDINATQTTQAPNLQAELNLTPEQIQKWRALNAELRDQEVAGNMKLRQARRRLADAMESSSPNEEVIKQRARELADVQSAMTQLQALRQARVLQILNPEQRFKLREIRARNQALRRQQQAPDGLAQRQQPKRGLNGSLTPAQRKALRQQQKQKR
ncbi:MAG: Spy/CpxP family protein refolding chaperone [Pyrinomonadaceae bacterium]